MKLSYEMNFIKINDFLISFSVSVTTTIIFLISFTISNQAWSETTEQPIPYELKLNNTVVLVDALSILLDGIGGKFTSQNSQSTAFGLAFSHHKYQYSLLSSENIKITSVTLLADLFLGFSGSATGTYLTIGAQYNAMDAVWKDLDGVESQNKDSQLGAVGKIGYQFVSNLNSDQHLLIQTGMGYASKAGINRDYINDKRKLGPTITLDALIGLQF